MPLFGKKKYTLVKVKKKDIPAGLWSKCPECEAPAYQKELLNNFNVCPKCGFHLPLIAHRRIELLLDEGTFKEMDAGMRSSDPLKFKGPKRYFDEKQTPLVCLDPLLSWNCFKQSVRYSSAIYSEDDLYNRRCRIDSPLPEPF